MAEHFSQHDYNVKLSTRTGDKNHQLTEAGFNSFVVDIETSNPINPAFLDVDILIINITHKSITHFQKLIAAINDSAIKQVLFVSSSSVYHNLNREVTEDEGAENPDSVLFQIENLFRQESGFSTTVLRFSGLIGPNRHPGRFFRNGKQVQQADTPVNLIHLHDCIGIVNAIVMQAAWQQTFNGCADTHPIKRTFYPHMAQLLEQPCPAFAPVTTPHFKIVSNAKVKRVLGYQFQHPDLMTIRDY